VLALPPGATTLATSPTASHELWAYAGCVLAFQFHIEFGGQLAHEKIWPAIKAAGRWGSEAWASSRGCLLAGGGAMMVSCAVPHACCIALLPLLAGTATLAALSPLPTAEDGASCC
jgi:hypothetical protein